MAERLSFQSKNVLVLGFQNRVCQFWLILFVCSWDNWSEALLCWPTRQNVVLLVHWISTQSSSNLCTFLSLLFSSCFRLKCLLYCRSIRHCRCGFFSHVFAFFFVTVLQWPYQYLDWLIYNWSSLLTFQLVCAPIPEIIGQSCSCRLNLWASSLLPKLVRWFFCCLSNYLLCIH